VVTTIVQWPSLALKQVSAAVGAGGLDGALRGLIDEMHSVLEESGGCGLSAIQIGVPARVVVTTFPDMPVLINPIISTSGFKLPVQEGCLSLPGFFETVWRHQHVSVQFSDADGQPKGLEVTGLQAQCLQHEVEHLNGEFFLKHVSSARRDAIRAKLRKGQR